MSGRLLKCLLLIVLSVGCTPAAAETAKEALKNFGLVGTWSTDCGRDKDKGGYYRLFVAAPMFGAIEYQSIFRRNDGKTVKLVFDVESAVRITNDKIQITHKLREPKIDDEVGPLEGPASQKRRLTIEKLGTKIRPLDNRSLESDDVTIEDGRFKKTGAETVYQERCLN
jgi:hypothetical protein